MGTTSLQSATIQPASPLTPNFVPQQSIGKMSTNDFLKVLVAQLQYQDPMQPMDDTQFIGQITQLTMLDRIEELAQVQELGEGTSMIGKQVSGTDPTSGDNVSGVVQSAGIVDNNAVVVVGGKSIPVTSLTTIADDSGTTMLRAADLIGKEVEVQSATSGQTSKAVVRSIAVSGGSPSLVLDDGTTVGLGDLVSVLDPGTLLSQASNFIGKSVDALTASGGTISGVVDRVRTVDGGIELSIGSDWVKIGDVTSVASSSG